MEKEKMYKPETNTPKAEIEQRINNLKSRLSKNNIDAALILQRADLFYFSGTVQQANLYIPAEGEPILMVGKSTQRAIVDSPIERIVPLDSPKNIPKIIKSRGYPLPRTLGMELDVLPTNIFFRYQRLFQDNDIVDISLPIRLIRAVKSQHEINTMRRAAKMSDILAGYVPQILREGMTELELAGKIEAEARRLGHQGIIRMRLWGSEIFYGHLMSGPSAAVPSYFSSPTGGIGPGPAMGQGPGFTTIQRHEPVLVDYMFIYNGYISDHTRIFSLGPLPEELVKAHDAMLDIQQMIKKLAKPGVTSSEIYDRALEKAGESGYAEHFMGFGSERIRFVGHGIGLEVDEFPFLAAGQDLQLQEGMIIAVEPKLIFPGKGVVGVENTHVVTKDGLVQFGEFPEEIVVV